MEGVVAPLGVLGDGIEYTLFLVGDGDPRDHGVARDIRGVFVETGHDIYI